MFFLYLQVTSSNIPGELSAFQSALPSAQLVSLQSNGANLSCVDPTDSLPAISMSDVQQFLEPSANAFPGTRIEIQGAAEDYLQPAPQETPLTFSNLTPGM